MSRLFTRCRILRQGFSLWLRLWVRNIKTIPSATVTLWPTDGRIIYLLPRRSELDLFALQCYCLKQQLPDPLKSDTINGKTQPRYLFLSQTSHPLQLDTASVDWLWQQLATLNAPTDPTVYLVLVSPLWSRLPGYGITHDSVLRRPMTRWQIAQQAIHYGRDLFIYSAPPVALSLLIPRIAMSSKGLLPLLRLARQQLARCHQMATGPLLAKRSSQLQYCLQATTLQTAITVEAKNKQRPKALIEKQTLAILNEMAADYSYRVVRCADRLFTWLWYRLYQGIEINHAQPVRQLALSGYELIYLPCHRSHMDYLLLSYVLYYQGLAPPYIAAGINLNFWPVGRLFRKMGAFFIRRSFKGNKLYFSALREYLTYLLTQGCSVEYFIEGGRSRTGRLLAPKTGLFSMSLQAVLNGLSRPVALVPIYLSYEHVMEAQTYVRELSGNTKQPESTWRLLKILPTLRNLGYCTVNFGQPLILEHYFDQQRPDWRSKAGKGDPYLIKDNPILVNDLAQRLMERINSAAAVNAVNLCVSILLAASRQQLLQSQLIEQMASYLMLWKNAPYSEHCTIPNLSAYELLQQVLRIGKVQLLNVDQPDPTIILPKQLKVSLCYYANNIQHLLVLPSLIANLLLNQPTLDKNALVTNIAPLHPILQADLFVNYNNLNLVQSIELIAQELLRQHWISYQKMSYQVNLQHIPQLQLLAAHTQPLLQRYWLLKKLLERYPDWNRRTLEAHITHLLKSESATTTRIWGLFDKGSTAITVLQQSDELLLRGLERLLPAEQTNQLSAMINSCSAV